MPSRLVVGTGSTARAIIDAVSDDRGELWVLTEDEHRAETLREDGISVTVTADIDRDAMRGMDITPTTVVVATETPTTNVGAAETAAELFPDAFLVCYSGYGATDAQRGRLGVVADRLVDPETELTDRLQRSVGEAGARTRKLQKVLRDIDGHLAVVTHDNPDPDAIASAAALGELAARAGCAVSLCYYGDISHQENRAFVNLLKYDLVNLDTEDDAALDAYDGFALVDHSRPGVNDQLPPDLAVDVVVDHHPPREPVEADFVDLRSEVGATSTLLTGYLDRFGVDAYGGGRLASALLYGIRVDTAEFTREATAADFEAAAALSPHVDTDALERVESPSLTGETLDVIGDAVRNREIRGEALASCVGAVGDRDALAQAADRLLELEDVTTTLVFGYTETDGADVEPTVYASARARGTRVDLGETLRLAFDRLGSAGGHADMAGAQIPLSALGPDVLDADGERRERIVREVLGEIFFDAVADRPLELPRVSADAYDTDDDDDGDDGDRPSGRRSRRA